MVGAHHFGILTHFRVLLSLYPMMGASSRRASYCAKSAMIDATATWNQMGGAWREIFDLSYSMNSLSFLGASTVRIDKERQTSSSHNSLLASVSPRHPSIMVDMTKVPEESPVEDAANSPSSSGNEKDADGWEKLMGDDLVMKVRCISNTVREKDRSSDSNM